MSAPRPLPSAVGTREWLAALVRVGLAEFGAGSLARPSPFTPALRQEASRLAGLDGEPSWTWWHDHTQRLWPLRGGALGRLIADYGLTPAQAFLLALVGEVEVSHLIDLTLAELQAPTPIPRPTVHLAVALSEALFGAEGVTAQR